MDTHVPIPGISVEAPRAATWRSILLREALLLLAGTVFLATGAGMFELQPEVSYVQKGVEDQITGEALELDYLELAGLLKWGLPLVVVHPHIFGGIAADFEVDKKTPFNNQFDTKSTDWNLILGADVSVPFGAWSLWGDGRYGIGLTDVSDSAVVSDLKNRAWIFSAGVGHSF